MFNFQRNRLVAFCIMFLFITFANTAFAGGDAGRAEAIYAPRFDAVKEKILRASADISESQDSKAWEVFNLIEAAQIQFDALATFVDDPSKTQLEILDETAKKLAYLAKTYQEIANMRAVIMSYRLTKKTDIAVAKLDIEKILKDINAEVEVLKQQIAVKTAEINNTPATNTVRIQELTLIKSGLEKKLSSLLRIKDTANLFLQYVVNMQNLFTAQDGQLGLLLTAMDVNAKVFLRAADYAAIQKSANQAFSELASVRDFTVNINALVTSWETLDKIELIIAQISIVG